LLPRRGPAKPLDGWGHFTSSVRYGPYVHKTNPFISRAAAGELGQMNARLEQVAREIERLWSA
ncbi:MAG: hypothetical protein ACRDVM_03495, partial [Acidimicrobiia bacterium]